MRIYFLSSLFHTFTLQDWWVDQHGGYVRMDPSQWSRAERFTDWAKEFLSAPLRPSDLLHRMALSAAFQR